MKIGYWECSAGIAGDMCLGSLIGCGVPLEYLNRHLRSLLGEELVLRVETVQRGRQTALQVVVDVLGEQHHHRHWQQIQRLLETADLPPLSKANSLRVFQILAEAEAKVHQMPVEKVHFHEVGAVDAIADIVGTCLGLEWLGIEKLICSPHPIGGGTVQAAHGIMTVPVPAVVQLWETFQVPLYSNGIEAELVTPTGAALAVGLAQSFGSLPPMQVQQIGRGAGSRELPIPNVLRLWVGESTGIPIQETVTVLETQIDDLNPQVIAYTCEQLLALGALDVFTQGITMKQGRPGTLLTVVCHPDLTQACQDLIFRETTTLGIRRRQEHRTVLEREILAVATPYGSIPVKIARQHGQVINIQPEFRDCAALASRHHLPVQTIWQAAYQAAAQQLS
ncbi:MAG: nickel pincer cofactor biosynthesis protein LarC [Thermostichales cyanobacterium SZTDM-1c_bins_54]